MSMAMGGESRDSNSELSAGASPASVASISIGWCSGVAERHPLWGGIALFGLAVAVFANGLSGSFYLDDNEFLERRPAIRTLSTAWYSLPTRRVGTVSFAINYRLHKFDPRGYRMVNIAIHGLAACALFGFARRTLVLPGVADWYASRATALGWSIAAVWLVHPLQTGSVTYVVQRFEALMGLFFLFALYALARVAEARTAWPWLAASLASVALAAQTKEIAAMFPAVAIAYDRVFLASGWRELARRRGWYHLAAIGIALWMIYQVRSALLPERAGSAGFGVASVTPWEYFRSQAGVLVHYLWLSVWPGTLCLDYRWPIAHSPSDIYVPGLLIVGLLAITAWALWRAPRWGFLGVCFFAILAPTSSIMPIADLAFEHRMYLPLAAVVAVAVLAAARFAGPSWPRRSDVSEVATRTDGNAVLSSGADWKRGALVPAALLGVVLVALSARTIVRNRDYLDPVRMWNSVLAVSPWNYRAHNQVALQYEQRGRLEDAERHFQETLRYRPDAWWVDVGIGNLRARQNRLADAERHFRRDAEHKAGVGLAAANLGRLREREKKWSEAVMFYDVAVARDPGHINVWLAKANAHAHLGQAAEAAATYRHVLELDPRSVDAKRGLARWQEAAKTTPVSAGTERKPADPLSGS